jgi:hypothetical protein
MHRLLHSRSGLNGLQCTPKLFSISTLRRAIAASASGVHVMSMPAIKRLLHASAGNATVPFCSQACYDPNYLASSVSAECASEGAPKWAKQLLVVPATIRQMQQQHCHCYVSHHGPLPLTQMCTHWFLIVLYAGHSST